MTKIIVSIYIILCVIGGLLTAIFAGEDTHQIESISEYSFAIISGTTFVLLITQLILTKWFKKSGKLNAKEDGWLTYWFIWACVAILLIGFCIFGLIYSVLDLSIYSWLIFLALVFNVLWYRVICKQMILCLSDGSATAD